MSNKLWLNEEKRPRLLSALLLGLCQGYSHYHSISQRPVQKTETMLYISNRGDLIMHEDSEVSRGNISMMKSLHHCALEQGNRVSLQLRAETMRSWSELWRGAVPSVAAPRVSEGQQGGDSGSTQGSCKQEQLLPLKQSCQEEEQSTEIIFYLFLLPISL